MEGDGNRYMGSLKFQEGELFRRMGKLCRRTLKGPRNLIPWCACCHLSLVLGCGWADLIKWRSFSWRVWRSETEEVSDFLLADDLLFASRKQTTRCQRVTTTENGWQALVAGRGSCKKVRRDLSSTTTARSWIMPTTLWAWGPELWKDTWFHSGKALNESILSCVWILIYKRMWNNEWALFEANKFLENF